MRFMSFLLLLVLATSTLGCASSPKQAKSEWAIAIHGGAGVIDPDVPAAEREAYARALATALAAGRDELAKGGAALDAVQKVVIILEDDPLFNAGRGAVFTANGTHELDASIMDGRTLACGAVAGVTTVRNPIVLARLVMEQSPHVLLMGNGAEEFATVMSVERVPNSYFDTERRRQRLEEWKVEQAAKAQKSRGTVGAVAVDARGNLAAATSTGGMTGKRWGRVGDSPIIGAGTYANQICAVSCTGTGEEFIRFGVARDIAALMEYKHLYAQAAAEKVVHSKLQPDDGGVIVVSSTGEIAMVFSTIGMFRGAADSRGRFDVAIWKKNEPMSEVAK